MPDITLVSKSYCDHKSYKGLSLARGNELDGLVDAGESIELDAVRNRLAKGLTIGHGTGKRAGGEFKPGKDLRHAGRIVRKKSTTGEIEEKFELGPNLERVTCEELAHRISLSNLGVIARWDPLINKMLLFEKVPGSAGNDIVFEMGPPEDLPEMEDPCFGIGTVQMYGGNDTDPASDVPIIINGIEFGAEDIKILKNIVSPVASSTVELKGVGNLEKASNLNYFALGTFWVNQISDTTGFSLSSITGLSIQPHPQYDGPQDVYCEVSTDSEFSHNKTWRSKEKKTHTHNTTIPYTFNGIPVLTNNFLYVRFVNDNGEAQQFNAKLYSSKQENDDSYMNTGAGQKDWIPAITLSTERSRISEYISKLEARIKALESK